MKDTRQEEFTVDASHAIERFLDRLKHERKLSTHTLRGYASELAKLHKLALELSRQQGCAQDLRKLTAADLRGNILRARSRSISPRSIARQLSVWRSFYRWLGQHSEVSANPTQDLRAPKHEKMLPKALSVDDTHTLMEAAYALTPEGLRDHAMLELFYSSGLRLAELVGLDVRYAHTTEYQSAGWLDLDAAEVTVTGKGSRRRTVPVGQKAIAALRAWLNVREQWIKQDFHPLFVSVRGNRLSPGVVRIRIKRLALMAGIPANVHPHVLRHSFASHLLQSSGDLRAVQEMLGHASIAATQVYTSLDFQHLAKIYDTAHPRAKKRDDA